MPKSVEIFVHDCLGRYHNDIEQTETKIGTTICRCAPARVVAVFVPIIVLLRRFDND
jgi:hypothetical protein